MSKSMFKKEEGSFQFRLLLLLLGVSLLSLGDESEEVDKLAVLDLLLLLLLLLFSKLFVSDKGASKFAKSSFELFDRFVAAVSLSFVTVKTSCKWHLFIILSKQMLVSCMFKREEPMFSIASVRIGP